MLKTFWQRYQLTDPYLYEGESRNFKESCFLELKYQNRTYLSELSVFQGLHDTNRENYNAQLPANLFQQLKLPNGPLKNLDEVIDWAHQYYSNQLPPNTLQALDTLLLEILGQSHKLPKKWQSHYQKKSWCCLCAHLITHLPNALHLQGLEGTFKIKIGRAELGQEIRWLKQWLKQNPKVKVRLDANKMWSEQEVEIFLESLTPNETTSIEYLEDPGPIESWQKLSRPHKPKLALEKLHGSFSKPDIWVYRTSSEKGFLLGLKELEKSLQESANLDVILSSSFETEVGLRWSIFLANILELKQAQGLGTLSHLKSSSSFLPGHFMAQQDKNGLCISRS